MRAWIAGLVTSLSVAVSTCGPARADEPWMFAQVTCAPTLGYFSIRLITIMNLPQMGPYLTEGLNPSANVREALRRENGIVDSDSLKREPFTCSVAEFKPPTGWGAVERPAFDVKVIGHLDGYSEETSYCRIVDNAEVFLDGKSIGLLVLNPCKNGERLISIEVAHDGVQLAVKKCVEPSIFDDPTEKQTVCTESPIAKIK
jgi:hypothetical protein